MSTPVLRSIELREGCPDVSFYCPGCQGMHAVWTQHVPGAGPRWTWNDDKVRPTFSPSILVKGTVPMTDAEHAAWMADRTKLPVPRPFVCHSFVRDGQIQFLTDCTHALAGQTVPLPTVEQ